MQFVAQLLFLLGYVLFVGPPRAIDLQRKESRNGGELSGLPVWLVLVIEAIIRVGLLLVVSVLLEQMLGYYWYSQLRIDAVIGLLLLVGGAHMAIYYLMFVLLVHKIGLAAGRLYRVFRNLLYSALPGAPVLMIMYLWEGIQPGLSFTDEQRFTAYLFSALPFVLAGIVEAILVRRKPLGLDHNIKL